MQSFHDEGISIKSVKPSTHLSLEFLKNEILVVELLGLLNSFFKPRLSWDLGVLALYLSVWSPLCSALWYCLYKPLLPTNFPLMRHERLIDWKLFLPSHAGKQSMLTVLRQDCSTSLRHSSINIHVQCCHPIPVAVPCHVLYVCSC